MTGISLNLYCLVDGESTSGAFPVKASSTDTVGDLKDLIMARKTNDFSDIDADKLTLWRVSIPDHNQASAITNDAVGGKEELNNSRKRLSRDFSESLDDNTYIIVHQPPPGLVH
ncbi:hypothetical protein BGZ81_009130 [Podila clonocystis]|nr:hypothetical protein BGZ81_009130 [Podila clonocystis]